MAGVGREEEPRLRALARKATEGRSGVGELNSVSLVGSHGLARYSEMSGQWIGTVWQKIR